MHAQPHGKTRSRPLGRPRKRPPVAPAAASRSRPSLAERLDFMALPDALEDFDYSLDEHAAIDEARERCDDEAASE